MYEIVSSPLKRLVLNTGQVEGLPANPRQWTKADIERIAKSLRETPELFEMRPCIVYPHSGKYVILAGSLRYCGAKENGDENVPCIVVPEGTPVKKLKEIVIKDNGSFGEWDYDALGNEWDDCSLTEWGVPAWNAEEEVENTTTTGEETISESFIKVMCEEGDIWQVGELQLMAGDAVRLEEILSAYGNIQNGE